MSGPFSVLQVLGRSEGGVAKHVADVVRLLSGRGDLRVFVAAPTGLPVQIPEVRYEVDIPAGALRGHLRAVRALKKIVAKAAPDVVHAHGLRAGIDSLLAARGAGCRTVVTLHNLALPSASRVRSFLQRRAEGFVLTRADGVVAPSQQIAEHLRKTVPGAAHKVQVVHAAAAEPPPVARTRSEVRSELGIGPSQHLIFSTARLDPQKDLPTLIRAVALVPDAVLAIAGTGPLLDELTGSVRAAGLEERVRFLGFRDDVHDLLRAADVFCLSSVWEAVSIAAQEAVAVGTPVVATRVGGIEELVENGRSGWLVPPGDDAALAEALREVLADPTTAKGFAEEALVRYRRTFSAESMADRLASLYREATG